MNLGNHEEGYILTPEGRALANQESHQWLRSQPHEIDSELDGHRLLVFHSTPWQPRGEYLTPEHKRFRELGTLGYDIIIHGHTHWQYAGMVGGTLVINPGSAGEPRDHRNGLRGSVAILDTKSLNVTHLDFEVPRMNA
jgi:protein phosphatase